MIIKYKNIYYKCNPTKIENSNDVEIDVDGMQTNDAVLMPWCAFLLVIIFLLIIL